MFRFAVSGSSFTVYSGKLWKPSTLFDLKFLHRSRGSMKEVKNVKLYWISEAHRLFSKHISFPEWGISVISCFLNICFLFSSLKISEKDARYLRTFYDIFKPFMSFAMHLTDKCEMTLRHCHFQEVQSHGLVWHITGCMSSCCQTQRIKNTTRKQNKKKNTVTKMITGTWQIYYCTNLVNYVLTCCS